MNIIRIAVRNPSAHTGAGNNTYLVVGREPALVDAGTGDPAHLAQVELALSSPGADHRAPPTLRRVLVTHGHPDHASGAAALAGRWPDAVFAKMPWPEQDPTHLDRWEAIRDGDVIPAGDGALRAVHTPGHAPDHLCFLDETTGTIFVGDLVREGGTVMIPASRGGSLAQYLASLERILALRPTRLLPGHGPEIGEPDRLLRGYLRHRRRRETQILEALAAGCSTLDAIVARIYTGLSPKLTRAAGESVLAHLVKLEDQNAVRRDAAGWRLV